MRARVYIYILSVLLLAGCNKSPVTEGTDMHEFTQEELQKKRLDDAFTVFFKKFNLDKVDNPTAEILSNSKVTIPSLGVIRYTYTKNGITLISMDVGSGGFVATLHGGIRLEGVGLGENGTKVLWALEKTEPRCSLTGTSLQPWTWSYTTTFPRPYSASRTAPHTP